MQIDVYIKRLLYRRNCVIVPGFGAFLAREKSAEIDEATQTLFPPSKRISFNAQLCENDGLLITEIAKEKKFTYEALAQEIERTSDTWKKELKNGKKITLTGIGTLWYNEAQKIQFQPENRTNYRVASFGLSSFAATPMERRILKEKTKKTGRRGQTIFRPEKQKTSSLKFWLKYAAIILLMISIGVASHHTYNDIQLKQITAQREAQKQVSHIIQEATFFDNMPLKVYPLHVDIIKKKPKKFYVIAGAFRVEKNIEKRIRQLKKKGYNAFYIGINSHGLHQVAYDSFENSEEATIFLRKVQTTESADAWLLPGN